MTLAEKLSLTAGAALVALVLAAAPDAPAQTPPPLPPAGGNTGAAADNDLPPPVSRRDGSDTRTDDGTRTGGADTPPPPPPPPDLAYFVLIGGSQTGPLGEARLIELIRGGTLTPRTQVWTRGMAGWDRAGNVAELARLIETHAAAAPPPPPPAPEFFAIVNGQQVGPLSPEQLKQAIAAGRIDRRTQVWTRGMGNWAAAGDVPELAAMFPPDAGRGAGATVRVESYCGATGKSGIGEGADFNTARDRAIKACIANGGLERCCPNSIKVLE